MPRGQRSQLWSSSNFSSLAQFLVPLLFLNVVHADFVVGVWVPRVESWLRVLVVLADAPSSWLIPWHGWSAGLPVNMFVPELGRAQRTGLRPWSWPHTAAGCHLPAWGPWGSSSRRSPCWSGLRRCPSGPRSFTYVSRRLPGAISLCAHVVWREPWPLTCPQTCGLGSSFL